MIFKITNTNFSCEVHTLSNDKIYFVQYEIYMKNINLLPNTLVVDVLSEFGDVKYWSPCLKKDGVLILDNNYCYKDSKQSIPLELRPTIEKYLRLYLFT